MRPLQDAVVHRRGLSILLLAFTSCFNPETSSNATVAAETTGGNVTRGDTSMGSPTSSDTSADTSTGCIADEDCADLDPCSIDTCSAGACEHEPDVDNPECTCATPADCVLLPPDDECRARTCDDGVCGLELTPAGTPLGETRQTAEDCKIVVCDGAGGSATIDDDDDVPDDGLECTLDTCEDGTPANTPVEPGTECAAGECDAAGKCVGCSDPSECGGESTFCEMVTCVNRVCDVEVTPLGTPLPEQTPADCQQVVCDGRGNPTSIQDDDDVPDDDGNACTDDTCQAGEAVHPPLPIDTACDQDAGSFCDGEGACTQCNDDSQCGGGSDCLVPACVAGSCTVVPAAAGTGCDDGLFCTATDTCNGTGVCIGTGDPCPGPDGDGNCSESCNEAANACTANDPAGSACNDGLFCTATDTCNGSGSCVGSGNPCPGPDGDMNCSESCNESTNSCNGHDPLGSDCGACRECNGSGSCVFQCSPLAMCCGDVCISQGQTCP